MFSQESSVKSFRSSDLKNLSVDQIIAQINSMFSNRDILLDVVFDEIVKEILLRSDCHKILVEILKYFWTLDMENIDSYIFTIINSVTGFNKSMSCYLIDGIKLMVNDLYLQHDSVLSIIPVLISNIRKEDNLYTGFIDISRINDNFENLIPLVKIMREMNTLTSSEKVLLIKRLLDLLSIIDLELCPGYVNEILQLCDKSTFQYCLGAVVSFFNQRPVSCSQLSQSLITVDSQKVISIQTVVLKHYYEIAKVDREFVNEILKFCKNNNALYSISGFMCIILLNLAAITFMKSQILEFMSNCIKMCYKDTKLLVESAFIREVVVDNFDMDSLLLNAIKYCCVSDRENISTSLLELGFLLINSGLPKSKIVSLKAPLKKKDETLISEMCSNDLNMSTQQKIGQAGIQMVIHLFKRLVSCRKLILDTVQNFILKESHKSSVFVYLELFADLISLMPTEIFNFIDETNGQPIFELFCNFPHDVAISLVNALLPLIRYSSSIRDKLLAVIMKNICSGRFQTRMICVDSSLILLKYLRITVDQFGSDNANGSQSVESVFLTQCSQFACTQIAQESKALHIDNSANAEICNQILQIIDECCCQYSDTKSIIYKGLVQVIERNFYFSGCVVLYLLDKLELVLDMRSENVDNLFAMNKILVVEGNESTLQENISVLVSCLAESVRHCKQNMPSTDILSNAVEENQCISKAVSKAEKTLKNLLDYLSGHDVMSSQGPDQSLSDQQILMEQFVDLYDVILVHFICTEYEDHEKIEKLFSCKETLLKNSKLDKKLKKDDYTNVVSLPSLIKSIRLLFECLIKEANKPGTKESNNLKKPPITQKRTQVSQRHLLELSLDLNNTNTVIHTEESSPVISLKEKVSLYLLNKAINLVKKIGTPEFRISHRNRKEICTLLSDLVKLCIAYYVNNLCLDNVDNLANYPRQIMQHCMTLYCLTFNKIIKFFTKSIDVFLNDLHEIKEHITFLQKSLELIKHEGSCSLSFKNVTMSTFIKLHKYIISRILFLPIRRLYPEIDGLLNLTMNIAIYCGIEDARQAGTSDAVCGSSRINILLLNNLNVWTYNLLKNSKLHFKFNDREIVKDVTLSDSHVCRCLVSVCLATARIVMPDFVVFVERFVSDMSKKIGSYSIEVTEKPKVTFEYIVHPNDILSEIINAISLALDDVDWLLLKWKCGWQEFKQRKAINNSQLSHLNSTPSDFIESSLTAITDQDRNLFEQLHSLSSIMKKMVQCSITNLPRLYSLVQLSTRLFDQLTSMVKQYIFLTKSKIGGSSSHFEKLVRISGGSLSQQASHFIVYIQKIESITRNNLKENKKNDDDDDGSVTDEKAKKKTKKTTLGNEIGRTKKDMRLIPNLVFSIEQYQRYLIELQKLTKIDFMSHVRTLNSRDFRIDLAKLQESLDQNVTIDMSDDDEDEEEKDVISCSDISEIPDEDNAITGGSNDRPPPKKKQRTET